MKAKNGLKICPGCKIENNIRTKIRHRIANALKSQHVQKNNKTIEYLGCTYEFYKEYIISLFTEGMTWEKYMAAEIHADHIIPVSSFDLKIEENKFKAFNYTNMQPLWTANNLAKGSKLDYKIPERGDPS